MGFFAWYLKKNIIIRIREGSQLSQDKRERERERKKEREREKEGKRERVRERERESKTEAILSREKLSAYILQK
jgi:hypothetical protein